VILEDVFRQERLATPGLRRHRRDDDAAADHDLRIAHEKKIRDREHVELWQLARLLVFARDAGNQNFGERRRRTIAQSAHELRLQVIPLAEVADDSRFDFFVFEDFFEQILQFHDVVGDEPDQLLKPAMLFARDLTVKDVVEEKLIHHRRHHEVDLPAGKMDQDTLQPADFAGDVETHAAAILQGAMRGVG